MDNNKKKGLSSSQVEESRKLHGPNVIVEADPPTFWEAFMEGFGDPMIKILCGISILMLVLYGLSFTGIIPEGSVEWYEPVGTIIAVILVNFISAKTSLSSDAAYRKLKNSTKNLVITMKLLNKQFFCAKNKLYQWYRQKHLFY